MKKCWIELETKMHMIKLKDIFMDLNICKIYETQKIISGLIITLKDLPKSKHILMDQTRTL